MKRTIAYLLFSITLLPVSAQKQAPVIFSVAGDPVTVPEFVRVYEKNLSMVTDPEQRDIANYLELYINYKLKLKDAYNMHLDTLPKYLSEYKRYRNQLLDPYLKDEEKEKDLIREAYDRMQYDVSASHIILLLKPGQDTLTVYNRLNAIRDSVLNGASFEAMARKYSDDRSAKKNGGNLGYFTVFDMVYPFETMAYNTPAGEISPVFRTRFGYHFIRVNDKRPARGKVEVAHIMIRDKETGKALIEKIKKELDNGGDFAALARQYSEDKGSAKNGGKLAVFGVGKMVKKFEDVAFSLKNEGDVSEPFQTVYGWHIVKLIKKYPIGSFEEEKQEIAKKVKEGKRALILGKSIVDKLAKQYEIKENTELLNNKERNPEAVLLQINDKKIPVSTFDEYMKKHPKKPETVAYENFKQEQIKEYYKEQLPLHNDELRFTLQEYREGLLLFELMKQKVWDYAEKDTTGLRAFFDTHRDRYRWGKRADALIVTTSSEEVAKKASGLLKEGIEPGDLRKQLLAMNKGIVVVKNGKFETGSSAFPGGVNFDSREPQILESDHQYIVVKINDIIPPGNKELDECRGRVISDYQDQIEKQWVAELRKRYPVTVNKKQLKKLKRKYK